MLPINGSAKKVVTNSRNYSVEWENPLVVNETKDGRPIHNELYVIEYNAKNKYLQQHKIDTVYMGHKVNLTSHSEAVYVIICVVSNSQTTSGQQMYVNNWFPLLKLEGEHPELVITKEMIPSFMNGQSLNGKGEVKRKADSPMIVNKL
ncbi:MAG: hypothetical protein Q4D14_06155 [Bacteroidales bacterium]|nr:hypothetical protein [Bacteroidales bacterium]